MIVRQPMIYISWFMKRTECKVTKFYPTLHLAECDAAVSEIQMAE